METKHPNGELLKLASRIDFAYRERSGINAMVNRYEAACDVAAIRGPADRVEAAKRRVNHHAAELWRMIEAAKDDGAMKPERTGERKVKT